MQPKIYTCQKPVSVQAVEWRGCIEDYEFLEKWAHGMVTRDTHNVLLVQTPVGVMPAQINDFIVRGAGGEFYPVSPAIFEKEYLRTVPIVPAPQYEVPMSLRTASGEWSYQTAKNAGFTHPLEEVASIREWNYWRLIPNEFPYDVAFKTHHMLLPKRPDVADWHDLNESERSELEQILRGFVDKYYDLWFVNCTKRRSVRNIFHIHLATYYEGREDMKL